MANEGVHLLGQTWIFGWYVYIYLQSFCNYYITFMSFFAAFFMQDWMAIEEVGQ